MLSRTGTGGISRLSMALVTVGSGDCATLNVVGRVVKVTDNSCSAALDPSVTADAVAGSFDNTIDMLAWVIEGLAVGIEVAMATVT
jgi:hypothetical protein